MVTADAMTVTPSLKVGGLVQYQEGGVLALDRGQVTHIRWDADRDCIEYAVRWRDGIHDWNRRANLHKTHES